MKKLLLFLPLLFLLTSGLSPQTEKAWEFKFSFHTPIIKKVSSDPYGFIYISDERGNIYKIDSLGKNEALYSPKKNSPATLLEGCRNVNLFLFYQNYQEYKLLDRFLTEISQKKLSSEKIGYARLATLSMDNNIWIIDNTDFSLKKLNLQFNRIDINSSLGLILPTGDFEFTFMREFDNNLYLADKNTGILVFDNLGNYKTTIPAIGIHYFSFFRNSIYFISENAFNMVNLLTGHKKQIPLPENINASYALVINNNVYFFENDMVKIFSYKQLF